MAIPTTTPKSSPYYYGGGTASAVVKPVTKPVAKPVNPFTPVAPSIQTAQQKSIDQGTVAQQQIAPPPGTNQAPTVQPATNPYDVSGDPLLQMTLANNTRLLNEAAGQKTADTKKLLLGFGSSELAKSMFGGDQGFQDAVANNPFSVLAQIAHTYEGKMGLVNQTNEDLNKQNLFYSGYRTGSVLPELARQRGQQTYDQTQLVQDAIDRISQQYTGVANQNAQNEIQARQDAVNRATQAALQSGYGPGSNPAPSNDPNVPGGGTSVTTPGLPGSPYPQSSATTNPTNPIMWFK